MIAWNIAATKEPSVLHDIDGSGDTKGGAVFMFSKTIKPRGDQESWNKGAPEAVTARPNTPKSSLFGEAVASGSLVRSWLELLIRLAIGQVGGMVTATLCLMTAVDLEGVSVPLLQMTVTVLVLRLGIMLVHGFRVSHELASLRLTMSHIWRDETTFALVFCAASFVFSWPLTPSCAALYLALNFAMQAGVHLAGRLITGIMRAAGCARPANRGLIIGTGNRARKVADALLDHPELNIHPVGFLDTHRNGLWRYRDLPLLGLPEELDRFILREHIDALFVADEIESTAGTSDIIKTAQNMGVTVHLLPMLVITPSVTLEIARLNGFATVVYRATRYRYSTILLKRLVDIFGALLLIVLSSPLMLATAIAIKSGSNGSILFTQVRSGRNGRRFNLYKFRTMTSDAERKKELLLSRNEMSGPVFKISNDPRVTSVGKFLRKYSIDELPQLFNVLAGDMSLVGPRPPLPSEVLGYEPWQRRKLSVRPGLTCLWQVNGRNAIDFDDWMKLDLQYIDTWSLMLDMKILARTVPTVLKGSGV